MVRARIVLTGRANLSSRLIVQELKYSLVQSDVGQAGDADHR